MWWFWELKWKIESEREKGGREEKLICEKLRTFSEARKRAHADVWYSIPFHLCFKIRTDFLWNYHVALWRFACFSPLLVFLPRGDGLMALFFSINHHISIVQSNNQFCAFILYYYLFWKLEKAFQLKVQLVMTTVWFGRLN